MTRARAARAGGAAAAALFLAASAFAAAEGSGMTSGDREHLLKDKFRIVTKVADLPPSVVAAMAEHTKQHPFRMANPGEEFQSTDDITKPDLPGRRLVFAGVSEGYCVMQYEFGGVAHLWWVVFFRLSGKDAAKPVWAARAEKWGGFASLDDLREGVRKGKLVEDEKGFW
jgi:hypothetical protein